MRPVFNWMARRTAASYGLISEAIMLVHEQDLDFDRRTLFNTVAANRYLKLLIVALRPELKSRDDGETLVALADFAAKYRPRLSADHRSRVGYIEDLLKRAAQESAKVRLLLTFVGERRSVVAQALDDVAVHLSEARAGVAAAYVTGVQPFPRSA